MGEDVNTGSGIASGGDSSSILDEDDINLDDELHRPPYVCLHKSQRPNVYLPKAKGLPLSCVDAMCMDPNFRILAEQYTWEFLRTWDATLFPWTGMDLTQEQIASRISNDCIFNTNSKFVAILAS